MIAEWALVVFFLGNAGVVVDDIASKEVCQKIAEDVNQTKKRPGVMGIGAAPGMDLRLVACVNRKTGEVEELK